MQQTFATLKLFVNITKTKTIFLKIQTNEPLPYT